MVVVTAEIVVVCAVVVTGSVVVCAVSGAPISFWVQAQTKTVSKKHAVRGNMRLRRLFLMCFFIVLPMC